MTNLGDSMGECVNTYHKKEGNFFFIIIVEPKDGHIKINKPLGCGQRP